jgi:hypothetical protein
MDDALARDATAPWRVFASGLVNPLDHLPRAGRGLKKAALPVGSAANSKREIC